MATEQERNKALVLHMIEEVYHKGNLDFINEAMAPDFKDHPPSRYSPRPLGGREALIETVNSYRTAMPDLRKEAIQVLAERDMVSYLGRMIGTHLEDYNHVPASGNIITVSEITNYRLEDGKIVERWTIFDVMGMMMQMGAVPPPARHD